MNYTPSWYPSIGDKLRMKKLTYMTGHGKDGDEFTVVNVSGPPENFLIILDHCTCHKDDLHRTGNPPLAWAWNYYHLFFEKIDELPITPEELAKALPLPSVTEVEKFFGIKENL